MVLKISHGILGFILVYYTIYQYRNMQAKPENYNVNLIIFLTPSDKKGLTCKLYGRFYIFIAFLKTLLNHCNTYAKSKHVLIQQRLKVS